MNLTGRQNFLDDLQAAVIAGVPIDVGPRFNPLSEKLLTLESLGQMQEREKVIAPASSDQAEADPVLPERLAVAAQVFAATNDMPLVLRGLSAGNLAARKAVRSLRWTIAYLIIVLLVAWACMMFFAFYVVPEIQSMRADMLLSRRPDVATVKTSLPWIGYLTYLFGALMLLALVMLCVGGIRRFVMLVGGRYFVRSRIEAIATEIAGRLVGAGVDSHQASELAFRVAGGESKRLESSGVNSESSFQLDHTPETRSFHLRNGDRHLEQVRVSVPVALLFLVGGCITLVYCGAVFAPVVELLSDLVTTGV